MCLILVDPCPAGETVSRREFADAWNANPDGAGIMFQLRGRLEVVKPLWRLRDAWRAYRQAAAWAEGPVVVHFRLATHGPRNGRNTHPHPLPRGGAIAHNGIIPIDCLPGLSDTATFAERVLSGVSPEVLTAAHFAVEMERILGPRNKIVAMTGDRWAIWNEDAGEWSGGRWYSSGRPRPPVAWTVRGWTPECRPEPAGWPDAAEWTEDR